MKKNLFLTLVLAFVGIFSLSAQSPVGIWKTVDDETGEIKSHVQIYEQNGKLYGKIIKLLRKGVSPDKTCDACKGDLKGKKLVGMQIVNGLTKKGTEWGGGKILDPEKGKEFECKIWVEAGKPNELKVRGYIGFLFRTQTWFKVS